MQLEPGPFPATRKVAVVAARFNEEITDALLDGCVRRLRELGVSEGEIDVARVPGSFEVPAAALRLARTGRYAAIACIGALIRGDTPHFEYISEACARGIMDVQLETGVPCAFGVITCNTVDQARERAGLLPRAPSGGKPAGHKGAEAAEAAVEMARLFQGIAES